MHNLALINQDKDFVTKAYVDGLFAGSGGGGTNVDLSAYLKKTEVKAFAYKDSLAFSELTEKPTTLAGYGITDAVSFNANMSDASAVYHRHIGYGYASGGWYGSGPAIGFGANGTYYAMIQAVNNINTPTLFYKSVSGGDKSGKWFQFLFSEGNANIESDRFSIKGDIVLHRNAEDGDTYVNYGPYANDDAALQLYGKHISITVKNNVLINGNEAVHAANIANYTAGMATQLATSRKIWGQSFDGTKDITGDLTASGHIKTEGQIVGIHSTGTYERFRIMQNSVGTLFQAGVNDGSARQGTMYLSGIDTTMMKALHIRADKTTIYGSLDVPNASATIAGVKIAAGQPLSFLDSAGGEHKIVYDETAGVIKVVGDFASTGENSAGGAGEELLDFEDMSSRLASVETEVENLKNNAGGSAINNIVIKVSSLDNYLNRNMNSNAMAGLGLSVLVANNMLNGAYNKVIDNSNASYPSVYDYTGNSTSTQINIFLTQGNGSAKKAYSLTLTKSTLMWTITKESI